MDRVRRAGAGATSANGTTSGSRARAPAAPAPLWRPPTAARGPDGVVAAAATSPAAAASAVASAPAATATTTMPTEAARATLVGNAREVPGPSPIPAAAVSGTIPAWLRGALVANGGGDYGGTDHLFDGLASVARLGINEGGSDEQATFAQRMICTQAYELKQKTGKLAFREFATAPPPDPPGFVGEARAVLAQLAELVTGKANFTDNASVNLIPVALSQAQVEAFRATGGAGGGSSEPAAAAAAAAATATETTTRPLLLAISETPGASYLVDPRTLDTVSRAAPDPAADGVPGMLTTAHPARLRGGKEVVNFTRTLPNGGMHVYKMALSGPDALKRQALAFIPDRRKMSPTWVHDFAATDGYAVILEAPIYMNLASLMLGGDRQPKGGLVPGASDYVFMDWAPLDGVRVVVVRLDGSEPTRYYSIAEPFFVFHFGNCFLTTDDAGNRCLGVDLASYDDPAILNDLRLAPLRAGGEALGDRRGGHGPGGREGEVSRSRYVRLTIPLDGPAGAGTVESPTAIAAPVPLTRADDPHLQFVEFPCVAPAYRGRADCRYAYALCAVRPTNMGNALAKMDLRTGASKVWHEPGGAPGEPVFVPRPGGEGEDDGAVLAFVAAPGGGSFVVVLDAREWTEVARVRLPAGVPYRFHGGWMPAAAA